MCHSSRMSDIQPKPGPSSSSSYYPPFRELAKLHADLARRFLDSLPSTPHHAVGDEVADVAAVAQAHALTSLAYTQMAPPARHRPRCTCRQAKAAAS